jgi:hypothetical protein
VSLQSKSNYVNVASYEGRKGEAKKVALLFSDVHVSRTVINKLAIVDV